MAVDIVFDALRTALGPTAAAYALLAIGLNIHFGFTGLLNFGQAGFMLVGAYGVAITVSTFGGPLWLGVIVGLLGAVVLALILGVPTLRLRADYLAITTIAAAEILRLLVRSTAAEPITGGVFGLRQFGGDFFALNPLPAGRTYLGPLAASSNRAWVMLVGWSVVALMTLLGCGASGWPVPGYSGDWWLDRNRVRSSPARIASVPLPWWTSKSTTATR